MAPTAAEMAMSMMGAADVNAGSELATRAVMEANGDAQREQVIVEAWAQGFNVGAVVTLILFVMCNYRRGVMLHALILVELFFALPHGFFIFFQTSYGTKVMCATAVPLYVSYTIHNVISWLKIRAFLPRWGSIFFIVSLAAVQPYWILESWANWAYNNPPISPIFHTSRYLEPLFRDPWWIFTTVKLVMILKQNYNYTLGGLIKTSPRFGIMLTCMALSIAFLVTDVGVTVGLVHQHTGNNPYWRLALCFKCASDTIFLDDFKSVLDHIAESALRRVATAAYSGSKQGKSSAGKPGVSGTSFNRSTTGNNVGVSSEITGPGLKSPGASKRWIGSRLTGRRSEDSGENQLMEEDGHKQNQIIAETTITMTELTEDSRTGSSSGGDHGIQMVSMPRKADQQRFY